MSTHLRLNGRHRPMQLSLWNAKSIVYCWNWPDIFRQRKKVSQTKETPTFVCVFLLSVKVGERIKGRLLPGLICPLPIRGVTGHLLNSTLWNSMNKLKRMGHLCLMSRRKERRPMGSWWSWEFRESLEKYPLSYDDSLSFVPPSRAPNGKRRFELISKALTESMVFLCFLLLSPKPCKHVCPDGLSCWLSPDWKCPSGEPEGGWGGGEPLWGPGFQGWF